MLRGSESLILSEAEAYEVQQVISRLIVLAEAPEGIKSKVRRPLPQDLRTRIEAVLNGLDSVYEKR